MRQGLRHDRAELKRQRVRPYRLARELAIPPNTLYHWLDGTRPMPVDQARRVVEWLGGVYSEARAEWRSR